MVWDILCFFQEVFFNWPYRIGHNSHVLDKINLSYSLQIFVFYLNIFYFAKKIPKFCQKCKMFHVAVTFHFNLVFPTFSKVLESKLLFEFLSRKSCRLGQHVISSQKLFHTGWPSTFVLVYASVRKNTEKV